MIEELLTVFFLPQIKAKHAGGETQLDSGAAASQIIKKKLSAFNPLVVGVLSQRDS